MPVDQAAAATAIRECIGRFYAARSSRGVYQAERQIAKQLGGRPVDIDTAAAARRFGEWLRTAGAGPGATTHHEAARAA